MITRYQKASWNAFCSEPLDKIEHYEEALAEGFKGWCIHHRLEIQQDKRVSRQELKDNGLYFGRPAEELVFMKVGEHMTLHMTGMKRSAETRKKIAESAKGRTFSTETRLKIAETLKGRTLSAEHRKKLSQSLKSKNNWTKGLHWWTMM